MMRKSPIALACLAWLVATSAGFAQEPEQKPAIRIRLSHPDEQLKEVIELFRGSKAANPAAALAAWKRVSKERNRLGKPLEALIAAMNPKMIEELKALDGAEVSIRFDPETGQPEWSVILPRDDGTFAALGSAMVLSGGAAEAPMGEVAIDRLAGPGSALMAKVRGGTLLASNREGLKLAQGRLEHPPDPPRSRDATPGLSPKVEPGSLQGAKSLTVRRFEELIRHSNRHVKEIRDPTALIQGYVGLEHNALTAVLADFGLNPLPTVSINPAWHDWTPKDRAISSFALAIDPAAKSWDGLFTLADRIEKIDTTRANVASIQVRLDLLARLSGLRLETDLLRHLTGVSGWVGSSDTKAVDNALLVFHLDDRDAADWIVVGAKPLRGSGPRPPGDPDRPKWLGTVEGHPLRITQSERDVVVAWGDGVLEASLQARDNPERSSGAKIRVLNPAGEKLIGSGALWPERIPGLGLPGVSRRIGDEQPPTVFWTVDSLQGSIGLNLAWIRLDEAIKRFLDQIPLDPPPDH
jgi:hypothetical protein